ncbi:MAG: LacI family DNA-binding transcriptional regulator [Chloroflexi bacterium]|nr:LacI family DNA-binding transcriptional regulator [Chloroflexota bacterium]
MESRKKEATLEDVARRADVSAKTVSRVVNNSGYVSVETRRRILDAVAELDYLPNRMARSLASNRSSIIGLTIPDITNPFFPEVIRGIEQVALGQHYNVLIHNTALIADRDRQALLLLEEMRVDGVIVCSVRLDDDTLSEVLSRQRHTVLINRTLPGGPAGVVRVDFSSAMQSIVDHLLESGRRRFGYLTIQQHELSYSAVERFRGFRKSLDTAGLMVASDCIYRTNATVEDSFSSATRMLSEHPEFDAIVCCNDLIAAGLMEACLARGVRIPEDVAVTGFDDIMFSGMLRVPLTTVHVPKQDLGVRAAKMLFDMINGRDSEREIVLDAGLVVRDSTR